MFGKRKKQTNQDTALEPQEENNFLTDSDSIGELTIDVYQTPDEIVIESPIAGVKSDDIDVHIENDMITIRGKREKQEKIEEKDYFYQECYWGSFSRTVALPTNEVDIDKAQADMEDGVLKIRIPKIERKKSKKLKIASKEE
ncbi:MAG: Hsp20/alpha crystallin family protein [Patescibacteria group bacterium]